MMRVRLTKRVAVAAGAAILCAGAAMPLALRRDADPSPNANILNADIPNVNILVEGQSNAGLFLSFGGGEMLRGRVQTLLGFHDGQSVTILGGTDRTMWSGVALVHAAGAAASWLTATQDGAWHDDTLERQFIAYLRGLPPSVRRSPTVIVWLHNETDSTNPALGKADWESAIRHTVTEARAALGQPAGRVPVDFVFVPADCPSRCLEVSGAWRQVEMLKAGYEDLESDPEFDARSGAQIGDADMDGTVDSSAGLPASRRAAPLGGLHMDPRDVAILAERLSVTIANQLWRYAQPGSPERLARGTLPALGPRAVSASRLDRRRISVAVALEPGSAGLHALSDPASRGAGWNVVIGKTVLRGVAAQAADGRVVVRFAADLPDDARARLYYGWGSGRIAAEAALSDGGPRPPGRNAAIYDDNGLPLWMPASGLAVAPG
jgi:hypothetical protein